MTSVAIFKWAVNPKDGHARMDGTVAWPMAKTSVGDDDHAAIKVAQAANPDSPVVGLTTAARDVSFAAARGAERTVAIKGLPDIADSTSIAMALADAVRTIEGIDVVAIGDSEWEPSVPGMVAGLLGWPAILAVDAVEPADDGKLKVTRRVGAGTQDVLADRPLVLGVAARREEQDIPGMRAILQARKKPVSVVSVADWERNSASRPLDVVGTRLPDTTAANLFDGSDPEAAAAWLVEQLEADGLI